MPYSNWREEARELKMHEWCRVVDVITYLREVAHFILSRPKTENNIFQRLPTLIRFTIPPVDNPTKRFPETELVLCSEFGKWRTEIDLLQLSLTVMTDPRRLDRVYPDYKTEGEIEIYAIERIYAILDCIPKECWERRDFERHFNLMWIEEQN